VENLASFPSPSKSATDADLLPPHDDEAEAGALGCVLSAEPTEAQTLFDMITAEHFYDQRHQTIFAALRSLRTDSRELNILELAQRLRDTGKTEEAGGFAYVAAIPDATPSALNFPTFLETLRDRATRRAMIYDAYEVVRFAEDPSIPRHAIEDAARRMGEAYQARGGSKGLTIRKPNELLEMAFDDSDRILGDRLLASGQSLVIAGAGSLGKSRLVIQLAAATIAGLPFIGLETQGTDLRWLILQAENANRRLHQDLAALRSWIGPDAWRQFDQQVFIHTLETDEDNFLSLSNPDAQTRIANLIRGTKPDVVVWDSLYNFACGDLNSDEDMTATLLLVSRLSRAGNPNREIVVLQHALTGKHGASRAVGYDRSSFSRNSKVLHAWTRAQINLAPGSPDSNDLLIVSCGKCSNGKEFAPFAIRLNPEAMIYETASDFDLNSWQSEVTGKRVPAITVEKVRDLCKGAMAKKDLARAIMDDVGCSKTYAYLMIKKAEKSHQIAFNKVSEKYVPKT
jgi:hypothetical protein